MCYFLMSSQLSGCHQERQGGCVDQQWPVQRAAARLFSSRVLPSHSLQPEEVLRAFTHSSTLERSVPSWVASKSSYVEGASAGYRILEQASSNGTGTTSPKGTFSRWLTSVIPAVRRLRLEDCSELKASLGYMTRPYLNP